MASYLYILCQALDIRALQAELYDGLDTIITEELSTAFGTFLDDASFQTAASQVKKAMRETLDATSTMDAADRMNKVAASSTTCLVDFFTGHNFAEAVTMGVALTCIPAFRAQVASRANNLLLKLRADYLSGAKGAAPASRYLNKTRTIYEYVRVTLGIRMHGSENASMFSNGLGVDDVTIGQNVSLIQEVRQLVYSTPRRLKPINHPGHSRWEDPSSSCRVV
jgi:phenylalanine ammonia-lyase